jgi:DNA-binding transcriptional LysR family regulator
MEGQHHVDRDSSASALIRSISHRPAGPGGASALNAADKPRASRRHFDDVRLHVETLGAVLQPVLDGNCAFGIVGLPDAPRSIVRERLMEVQIVPVASPSHPLVRHPAPMTIKDLSGYVQLVLAERASPLGDREFGVVSAKP